MYSLINTEVVILVGNVVFCKAPALAWAKEIQMGRAGNILFNLYRTMRYKPQVLLGPNLCLCMLTAISVGVSL